MKYYTGATILFGFWLIILILLPDFGLYSQNIRQELTFTLPERITSNLYQAPSFRNNSDLTSGIPMTLTLPDGRNITYHFFKNEVLHPELQLKHPEIATLTGYNDHFKNHFVQLTLYNAKISVFILTENEKPVIIENTRDDVYKSYHGVKVSAYACDTDHSSFRPFIPSGLRTSTNGATLRNYDIAIVITDEYEAANGSGSAAIATAVTTINNMTAIYKRDLAVTFTANVRPETSAFNITPPGSLSANYGGQCVAAYFSSGEYDLGQVFHNFGTQFLGGAGIAQLSVVCNNSGTPPNKSRSWSEGNPNNNYGFLSIVVHEVAHMFSATHTFNSNDSACNGQRSNNTAYEPGSGTSLMSYPGVCNSHNITTGNGSVIYDSSPYFHISNLEQMVAYINGSGNSCATTSATGNTPPMANANPCNAGSPVSIPANTPFELIASHTDPDPEVISYNWEQYDLGPPYGAPNAACSSTTGPIFRSYPPSNSPSRIFPDLQYVISNANVPPVTTVGECLPSVSRLLNFRLTVRDNNNNGGGIDVSAIQLSVNSSVGPLSVSAPNTNVSWAAGSSQTITWNGSNSSSICNLMNIRLSVDGGMTYPYLLVGNTPNDGSQSVTLPSNIAATTRARIKVESNCFSCVKFFDISNVNFTITSSCTVAGSSICTATPLSAPYGDAALNLGLSESYGSAFSSKVLTTSGSVVNVAYNLTPASSGAGNCTSANFSYAQTSVRFKISMAGTYTFVLSTPLPLTLYNGTYNTSSPCTNYIGSTAFDLDGVPFGNASFSNTMQLTLNNMCGEYTAVLFAPSGTSATLSISGPAGAILYENIPPSSTGNSYTYVAVNNSTGFIAAASPTSSFTTLNGGSYCIYGVHYSNNHTPSSWTGQTLDQLLASGNCLLASSNCKPVTVTCAQTVTSNNNAGPGTIRDIASCVSDGAVILFGANINPILTAPLILNKNITFDGNTDVSNNPVSIINLNFSGNYGLKIDPSKTVTIKDIKVTLNSTTTPVIQNEGNLILNNSIIMGNVNPVVSNQSGSSFQAVNNVIIKKL